VSIWVVVCAVMPSLNNDVLLDLLGGVGDLGARGLGGQAAWRTATSWSGFRLGARPPLATA